ncbi:hypothetical protein DY000_02003312 [Brassica cretica]|uniref:Uncharacterized protein n=1 Tax=Brassica cretica TaxID=69181 RepID=A0ABQ7CDQ7_BRACR|nr:hypothetical protein DY000_02003312 [Brassica cretica]
MPARSHFGEARSNSSSGYSPALCFQTSRTGSALISDLNFREGRFDWSAFHRFGFVVDGAPRAPSLAPEEVDGFASRRVYFERKTVHTRGGVVSLFPQRAVN